MKNIHSIFLLLTLFLSSFSIASESSSRNYQTDRKIEECNVSSDRDLDKIYSDMKNCVDEELNNNTELATLHRNLVTPDEPEEVIDSVKYLYSFIGFIVVLVWISNAYFSLSDTYTDQLAKRRSDFIFKTIVVFAFVSLFGNVILFEATIKSAANHGFSLPLTQLTTLSKVRSESDTVVENAVTSSMSQVQQKALDFNSAVVDQHLCAVAYKQELLASYGKETDYRTYLLEPDFYGASYKADDQVMCIESFLEKNKDKSIQELGGSTLLAASVKQCSLEHSDHYHNCGSLNANTTITEIDNILNQSAQKMVNYVDTHIGTECKKDLAMFDGGNGRDEKYVPFCSTLKDGVITTFNSDATKQELQSMFTSYNEELSNSISTQLKNKIFLTDRDKEEMKQNSKTYLLSIKANVYYFLGLDNEKSYYINKIKNLLDSITINEASSRMKTNGYALSDKPVDSNILNKARDYFNIINQDIRVMFESSSLVQSALLEEFSFLDDPKLLFGEYYGDEFRVNFNVFKGLKDYYTEIMTASVSIKLVAQMNIRDAKINDEPHALWSFFDSLSFWLFLLANAPKVFVSAITFMLFGWIAVSVMVILTMTMLEIGAALVLRNFDVIAIFRRIWQLLLALFSLPALLIFSLGRVHIAIICFLPILAQAPLLLDGWFTSLMTSIVIYFASIFYLFKSMFWVNQYLQQTLQTTASGFKTDIKNTINKVKNII